MMLAADSLLYMVRPAKGGCVGRSYLACSKFHLTCPAPAWPLVLLHLHNAFDDALSAAAHRTAFAIRKTRVALPACRAIIADYSPMARLRSCRSTSRDVANERASKCGSCAALAATYDACGINRSFKSMHD